MKSDVAKSATWRYCFPDMDTQTKTKKPIIALKAIKHSEFASEETHCYQAMIYVDGKRFAQVKNDGHGGGDMVRPIKGPYSQVLELEELIKETYETEPCRYFADGFQPTLESICCGLVNMHLREKDLKRRLRAKCLTVELDSDGNRAVFAYKAPPTEENIQAIGLRPGVLQVLNRLPLRSALALCKEVEGES